MASEAGLNQRPPPVNPDCDAGTWRKWRKLVEAHAVMTEFSEKETERAATIVTLFGLDALYLFDSLPFATEADKSDLKKTLGYLEDHFVGKANVSYERFIFNTRGQQEGETFPQYLAAIRQQASLCDFDNITKDQILRDRLICGIRQESVRQALLGKQNLTLGECILHCRSQEQSRGRKTIMRQSVKQEPTDSGLQASASIFSTKGVLPQRNALARSTLPTLPVLWKLPPAGV